MYPNNPMLNQQMAQLEQEFLQRKQNLVQNFYAQNQQQNNGWGQQNMQTQQSQSVQPTQNVNWIYVSGVDDAKNHIVQPGQTAWMMDNNNPYIYVKSVDNLGGCDFHIFEINEITGISQEQTKQQIDMSGYVPRGEFDALKEQVEQLTTTQKKPSTKSNKGVEDNG